MTAGAGILHIERPPEALVVSGGLFHGIQLWVNLPAAQKWVEPRYQDIGRDRVTLLSSPDGGSLVRVIAGQVGDRTGPGVTHTPITIVHATVAAGARLELPWDQKANALVYALDGRGLVGADQVAVSRGQLAMLGSGDSVVAQAAEGQKPLELFVLGGRPIGEPVAHYGPFVMNNKAELVQAYEDFQNGRLGTVPAAHMVD
jgi:redox-sensitive bicupin YhaK (pirin superfamily)